MKSSQNQLQTVYNVLFAYFGPQGWWPSKTSDETIMGAILTQNVAWSNVEKALVNLKDVGVFTLDDVLKKETGVLADLILPARFSKQKAVYLKEIALFFKEYHYDYQGLIEKYPLAELRKRILDVKGVGNETGDTILLYALFLPSFVIDAYTKRIFSRLGLAESEKVTYHHLQEMFHSSLSQDTVLFNEYHALIVRLAKDFCVKRNPICPSCPLNGICPKKIA